MENASKALLIAGAILLVIAIIAIAMSILNQGQEVTNRVSGQFDTLTIQSHNSQFTSYSQLDRITKSQLTDLVSKVKSSNVNNYSLEGSYDNDYTVLLTYGSDSDTKTAAAVDYKGCSAALNGTANFYRVTVGMSDLGIITTITVAPV